MRVEKARYALSVVRHGSLRGAAADLGVSQPTLSAQLVSLEEQLDTVLFVRGRHGATATPAMLSLIPLLEAMVEAEDRLAAAAMDIGGTYEGHVRIGATSLAVERVVAPAIASVATRHPALQFSVHEEIADEIVLRVGDGSFDFGIVTLAQDPRDDHLRWTLLQRPRLGVFVPQRHPLYAESVLAWRQLTTFPLVCVKERSALWAAMSLHLESPNVVAQAGNIRSVQVMAHHGVGLGIAPEPPTAHDRLPGCRWVPLDDDAVVEIQLCQRRNAPLSRAAHVVRDAVVARRDDTPGVAVLDSAPSSGRP